MRQSTSIKFNYGGVQGNTYNQPNRATTYLQSQPPPSYSVSQTPIKMNQTTTVVSNHNQVKYQLNEGSLHQGFKYWREGAGFKFKL